MPSVETYLKELHAFTNSIDFKSNELSEVKKFVPVVSKILGLTDLRTYVMNLSTKNMVFTRARKNTQKGMFFNKLEQLNYPKPEYINKHNRANVWRQSRFYCSDVPATSLFEVRPNNEWVTSIDIKITKPELKLLAVDMHSKYSVTGDETFTDEEIAFNLFLKEKFTQPIDEMENHLYLPTAILTNLLIGNVDGIVYPSVASNLKGENFVLRTEIIDNYQEIREVRIQETYNHSSDNSFNIRCLYKSNEFHENGEIKWRQVTCSGHKISEQVYHKG